MSSYHILNAVWVGVFPMLAVTVIIGIAFYIICCLNRIKIRCVEYCYHKKQKKRDLKRKKKSKNIEADLAPLAKKKSKKKSSKKKCIRSPYDDDEDENNDVKDLENLLQPDEDYLMNQEINPIIKSNQKLNTMQVQKPPPLPLSVPPPQICKLQETEALKIENEQSAAADSNMNKPNKIINRASLTLDLRTNNNNFIKPKSILQNPNKKSSFVIDELESEPIVIGSAFKKTKNSTLIRSSKSLNIAEPNINNPEKFNVNNSNNNIEQLIVHELKESPKSIYARLKNLKNRTKRKPSMDPPSITDMDRSPNSGFRYNFMNRKIPSERKNQEYLNNADSTDNEKKPLTKTSLDNDYNRVMTSSNERNDGNGSLKSSNSFCESTCFDAYDEQRSSSTNSSSNDLSRKKTNFLNSLNKSTTFSKRLNTNNKKHRRIQKNSSGSALNSPNKNGIKRAELKKKQQLVINNCIQSDLEIEDELIFTGDNDSLSSAGIYEDTLKTNSQKGSQITLTNRNSMINLKQKQKRELESRNEDSKGQNSILFNEIPYFSGNDNFMKKSTDYDHRQPIHAQDHFNTSISDIDPDDNILKNLLVKDLKNNDEK